MSRVISRTSSARSSATMTVATKLDDQDTASNALRMIDGIFIVPAAVTIQAWLCSLSTNLPGALQHGNIANHAVSDQPESQAALNLQQQNGSANRGHEAINARSRDCAAGAKHSVFDGL